MATDYVCRVLNEMDRRGVNAVTPRAPFGELQDEGILDALRAGYVQRGGAVMPRQGRDAPWRVLHHYEKDRVMFRRSIEDPALEWGPSALRPAFKASLTAVGSRLRSS